MRVLWLTGTPSAYSSVTGQYGCGWISSLEEEMSRVGGIDLAIAFFMGGQPKKVKRGNVTYYPIENPFSKSFVCKLRSGVFTSFSHRDQVKVGLLKGVIDDFKPDVIEVFGSESFMGLVAKKTKIPVVLHIQGVLTPYFNAYFPPGVSKWSYAWSGANPMLAAKRYMGLWWFRRRALRELDIVRSVKYFVGRTDWDRRVSLLFNPEAKYFFGGEILREVFYLESRRNLPKRLQIVSTLSAPLYKGHDVILKTAELLRDVCRVDFEWKVFGTVNLFWLRRLRRAGLSERVRLLGSQNAEAVRDALLNATVFVHPSYIDNSPNSVCEAQMLGIPVIAADTGGVSSLIENGKSGYLVPANDPYQTAFLARQVFDDVDANISMGCIAQEVARRRHARNAIVNNLVGVYNEIVNGRGLDTKRHIPY